MSRYNSATQTQLGVKNFKREFHGIAFPLSQILPIDPKIEGLDDPKTFNDRFNQLGEAVRYSIYAAADIAIRDKRYLETFLSNYTNPIASVYQEIDVATNHLARPNWEDNGLAIEFPQDDPRVEVNIDALSRLNLSSVFFWVFINGVLLDEDKYDVFNTAYGVKAYIKREFVNDGDSVSIQVNRIYNQTGKYVRTKVKTTGKEHLIFIPTSDLGNFYHHKYISVYVKREKYGKTYYQRIPENKYHRATDVTGKSIKLDIFDFQMAKDEELLIFNNVNYWYKHLSSKKGDKYTNEISIVQELADRSTIPVPFSTVEDFDVFFNNYHLTAGKHFTLIKGGNEFAEYRIKLLSQAKEVLEGGENTEDFDIKIFKNEAVAEDMDVVIIREDKMQNQGLIRVTDEIRVLPLCPRLGQNFLAGRLVSNRLFDSKNRHIMALDVSKVGTLNDFEHRTRVVSTLDLDAILETTVENLSEFDIVTEYIGMDNITGVIYKDLPRVKLDPSIKTVEELFPSFEWYEKETAAVEQLRVITDYYYRNHENKDLLLDGNKLTEEHGYPIEIINKLLVLDSNMKQSKVYVLDTNHYFQNAELPLGVDNV